MVTVTTRRPGTGAELDKSVQHGLTEQGRVELRVLRRYRASELCPLKTQDQ